MSRPIILAYILFFIPLFSMAQNLVPNGGFEAYHSCPGTSAQMDSCMYWKNFGQGSSDYFNGCVNNPNGPSVPNLWQGYQNSHSGYAMAGFYAAQSGFVREYIQVKLTENLDSGKLYYISFYVNLKDNSAYSIGTMGMYLSDSIQNPTFIKTRFNVSPQVLYNQSYSINDTAGWTLVKDTFIPDNNTIRFITIGNFHNDSNSRMTQVSQPAGGYSYYFIDNVCISFDPDYCERILHLDKTAPTPTPLLFPNPLKNNESLTINLETDIESAALTVIDLLGNVIHNENIMGSSHTFQFKALPGIYFVRIDTGSQLFVQKLLVRE